MQKEMQLLENRYTTTCPVQSNYDLFPSCPSAALTEDLETAGEDLETAGLSVIMRVMARAGVGEIRES